MGAAHVGHRVYHPCVPYRIFFLFVFRRGGVSGGSVEAAVYPRPNPLDGNSFAPATYFNMFCGVRAGMNPAPTVSPSIPPCGGFVGTVSPSIPVIKGGTRWVRRGGVHPRPNPLDGNYFIPPCRILYMFCGARAGINPAPTIWSPSPYRISRGRRRCWRRTTASPWRSRL